ncbi:tRNA dihydrouridine synthase DusB [Pseudoxanthobacter sp. M-2]|uniref:tRNA dihydrouridine synthase DusB n=1 Tax=Pseudoxanthobacter sp. M-2 TaxID=3078754 RepID=UPI0038FBF2C3
MSREPTDPHPAPSFRIGTREIAGRCLLAPMAGITDLPVRRLASRLGAPLVVSEMIAGEALANGEIEARLKAKRGDVSPHAVQIAGCTADAMATAARIAEATGADIIDINMGCPAKRVVNGWAGSALMREPDHALSLIEAVVAAVKVPVTVKMRLGWDDDSRNAPDLARRAEAAGVAMVTVHGRTRCQFYKGAADWDAIAAVKAVVSIPVVANGDLTDVADAPAMLARSGADAVMVGRGAQGRPWLPGDVAHFLATGERRPEPTAPERRDMLLAQYEEMLSLYGRALGIRVARKHIGWSFDAWPRSGAPALRKTALTSEDPAMVMRLIAAWFDDAAETRVAA